jgi:hypothetical protein
MTNRLWVFVQPAATARTSKTDKIATVRLSVPLFEFPKNRMQDLLVPVLLTSAAKERAAGINADPGATS